MVDEDTFVHLVHCGANLCIKCTSYRSQTNFVRSQKWFSVQFLQLIADSLRQDIDLSKLPASYQQITSKLNLTISHIVPLYDMVTKEKARTCPAKREVNMKIDYDLLREILLYVEASSDGRRKFYVREFVKIKGREYAKSIIYHMNYLFEIDYVIGSGQRYTDPIIRDITAKGREFLEATRDDSIWQKTKNKIGDEISNRTVTFVLDTAIAIGKSIVGHIL